MSIDHGAQARQSLQNLSVIAKAAGTSLSKTVKTTVFLTNMPDFAAVNEGYAKFFPELKPACSCIAVKVLPVDTKVEIEAIVAAE